MIIKQKNENGDWMDKYQLLSHFFGYSQFRAGQEVLIDGVLSGRDVFGIVRARQKSPIRGLLN